MYFMFVRFIFIKYKFSKLIGRYCTLKKSVEYSLNINFFIFNNFKLLKFVFFTLDKHNVARFGNFIKGSKFNFTVPAKFNFLSFFSLISGFKLFGIVFDKFC